jgi:hypothetical protein
MSFEVIIFRCKKVITMAYLNTTEAQQLMTGVVRIHKMVELRKLHQRRRRSGASCGNCKSFCHSLGLQKETREFIKKYQR